MKYNIEEDLKQIKKEIENFNKKYNTRINIIYNNYTGKFNLSINIEV